MSFRVVSYRILWDPVSFLVGPLRPLSFLRRFLFAPPSPSPSKVDSDENPILDAMLGKVTTTHEALGPGFRALLHEINELVTEPAPEADLTIATNATGIDLGLQNLLS
jgi:hypothetical protein